MPKIKIHSGAAKRFKKTGSGLKRKQANKRHILTKMSTKSKRQLTGTTSLAKGNEKIEGSGIGLAIVSEIMNNHEGEIKIESEERVGTKIFLIFKRA